MKFKHSPERDEEVFGIVEQYYSGHTVVLELLAIAKKWRSKAQMREARIKELEGGDEFL